MSYAFSPVLVAQGALSPGGSPTGSSYAGAKLPDFKLDLLGLVAVMVFAILGPLLVFGPQLAAAKRAGLREYGTLAERYVARIRPTSGCAAAPRPDEPLIGSGDIQSLADLGNSFEVVKGMKFAPFTVRTVGQLGVATLLPVAPLLLTTFSLELLIERLLKIVF